MNSLQEQGRTPSNIKFHFQCFQAIHYANGSLPFSELLYHVKHLFRSAYVYLVSQAPMNLSFLTRSGLKCPPLGTGPWTGATSRGSPFIPTWETKSLSMFKKNPKHQQPPPKQYKLPRNHQRASWQAKTTQNYEKLNEAKSSLTFQMRKPRSRYTG